MMAQQRSSLHYLLRNNVHNKYVIAQPSCFSLNNKLPTYAQIRIRFLGIILKGTYLPTNQ